MKRTFCAPEIRCQAYKVRDILTVSITSSSIATEETTDPTETTQENQLPIDWD